MRVLTLACVLAALPLAGCMRGGGATADKGMPVPLPGATATLADPGGAPRGTVRIMSVTGGLRVVVAATGLPPGVHGVHLHTVGKCEAPAFASAGGHWNPTMKKHGMMSPDGPHEGDLPNLTIAADGTGRLDATIAGAMLEVLMDADGAALVVHADADDGMTDPSGNSGARIACGVLTAT